jgi:5'-methylthioadenosine phosphorylase
VVSAAVPKVEYAIVGGSATVNCRLPEDTAVKGVEVVERDLHFETPFGSTQAFKLLRLAGAECDDGNEHLALAIRMHGWTTGENWAASRGQQQVFWVLEQAGVRKVVGNAGVGAVSALLDPGDLVLADDIIDENAQSALGAHATWPNSVNLREPFCAGLRHGLADAARGLFSRVFQRGVMATVEGPWLEGVAQVRAIRALGADLVAHSTCPRSTSRARLGPATGRVPGGRPCQRHRTRFDRELMISTYRSGAVPVATIMLRAHARRSARVHLCQLPSTPLNWHEP